MEKINLQECSICGNPKSNKIIAKISERHNVVECSQCAVHAIYPKPSIADLSEYYKDYYLTRNNSDSSENLVQMHSAILNCLVSKAEEKSILQFLDYGFGTGAFLKLLAQKGYSCVGVEISDNNYRQLKDYVIRHNLSIKLVKMPEETLDSLSNRKFDVITLFQVIEHDISPLALLKSLSKYQNPGGLMYIECPNNDALYNKTKNILNKILGRKGSFKSLKYPEHLYGFNKKSLEILLKRVGYAVIEIGEYHVSDGVHQVESIYWWPPAYQNARLWHPLGLLKSAIWLFDVLSLKCLGSGSGLYLCARKL